MKNLIKELREEKKLNATAFAKKIGISRQSLFAIEKSKAVPKLETLMAIAKELNCPLEKLAKEYK